MKQQLVLLFVVFSTLFTACGNQPVAVPTSTSFLTTSPTIPLTATPDPCRAENLKTSIKAVNDLMREFDDASKLASNLAKNQLPPLISDMQRIRRVAEDQIVPKCMNTLKQHQLAHMNSAINTMLAFVGGADSNTLNTGLAQARQEHDLYTIEIVKLLDITPNSVSTPIKTTTP